jgi:hypothetical protein
VQGAFDFGTASLREAVPSLRMTELVADWRVDTLGPFFLLRMFLCQRLRPVSRLAAPPGVLTPAAVAQERQTSAAESRICFA